MKFGSADAAPLTEFCMTGRIDGKPTRRRLGAFTRARRISVLPAYAATSFRSDGSRSPVPDVAKIVSVTGGRALSPSASSSVAKWYATVWSIAFPPSFLDVSRP